MHLIIGTGTTNVNFAGAWSKLWTSISGSLGSLTTLLAVVGMLLVVGSVLAYIWERRRGQGGRGHSGLLWTVVAGMVLAAPDVVLPAVLTLIDFLANAIASAITKI